MIVSYIQRQTKTRKAIENMQLSSSTHLLHKTIDGFIALLIAVQSELDAKSDPLYIHVKWNGTMVRV